MKVLLIKEIKGLGKAGEIKDVKEGYGQNFLLNKGLAQLATTEVLRKFEANKKKEEEILRFEKANAEQLKKQLSTTTIELSKSVGTNGTLFGTVTKEELSKALREQKNIELDKKNLECSSLKTLGKHTITAKLGHGIHATFTLDIKAQ
ncbi:50S ribosomal protein L9 [Campylobacter sp. MIT 21-1685]|uniref:50S ribosomal protein L9 n=1 Tax=unclassified Campylobacter TaxID=2593542 RepID=UPI00224B07C4|nr:MULTISPECIES: 50S ribosomal protein L9 [unclassified Campylobacter]MCX2683128.1 50S ribosomal protein L9 [Campylobacter sp. MIT 21-1684]MCX2751412.1 50S ribosomal protein L9 [Campylobacter sp. MIT 21-1682]MCX2807612.1 50S ribosomal protein L9 [Campylobacter sp. MIT 21-1685]